MFCRAKIIKGICSSLCPSKCVCFYKKKSTEMVTECCLIFSDVNGKMSSLEKTLHDIAHKQTHPRPPEVFSGEHKH